MTPLSKTIAIIMFALLPFGGFYLGLMYGNKMEEVSLEDDVKFVSNKTVPNTPVLPNTEDAGQTNTRSDLANIVSDIFNLKITNNQKNGEVDNFAKEIDVSDNKDKWRRIFVSTYSLSQPITTFKAGYEGMEWQRDLKKEVQMFKSLVEGSQVAPIYDDIGTNNKAMVELKTIGTRNWAVYDTFFKPGGNWNRHNMTYDSNTNQLIYVVFAYMNYGEEVGVSSDYVNDDNYFTNVVYPQDAQLIHTQIESVLAQY